jgi:hypothetical protein
MKTDRAGCDAVVNAVATARPELDLVDSAISAPCRGLGLR